MLSVRTFIILFTIFLSAVTAGFILNQQSTISNFTPRSLDAVGQPSSSKLKIAAAIFPLYDIAKNIGGDKVEVSLILPPGASPHTFDLKPSDVSKIQQANLVLAIGHELDDWVTGALNQPNKKVVVDKNMEILKREGEDDPHYWLGVENAKQITLNISEILINQDPDNKNFYLQNTVGYLAQLEQLAKDLTETSFKITNKNLITFHDAWYYFAREFGFKIITSFEPFPGKTPSPQGLQEFESAVKASGAKVIYSEPQIASDLLQPVAKDLGVKVAILDPIGGAKGRDSFIKLMKYNMEEIGKNR